MDEIAANYWHEHLRMPSHHCLLNPIELVFAQIKTKVYKKANSNANQLIRH